MALVGRSLSSRRLWAIVGLLFMLGATLTVLQVRRSGAAPGDNRRIGSLLAIVDWNEPVLLPDGHSVLVYADVMHLPAGYCLGAGLPRLQPSVTETAGSVTIKVRAYASHPPLTGSEMCAAVGHVPVPVTAQLEQPLGRRSLLDAKGHPIPVLDAAKAPAPTYLPPSYRQTALGGTPATGSYRRYEHLPWPSGGYQLELHIDQYLPPIRQLDQERLLVRGSVLGRPARVVQSGGTIAAQRCVIWTEQPWVWSICSLGGVAPEISATQLLRIGNSLRLD